MKWPYVCFYRLNTGNKDTSIAEYLIDARPGSILDKVTKINIKEHSFNDNEISMEKTVNNSKQAFFHRFGVVNGYSNFSCQVSQGLLKDGQESLSKIYKLFF